MPAEIPDTPVIARFDLGHDKALDKLLGESHEQISPTHTEITKNGKKEDLKFSTGGQKADHFESQLLKESDLGFFNLTGEAELDLKDSSGRAISSQYLSLDVSAWQPGLIGFNDGKLTAVLSRQLKDQNGNVAKTFDGECSVKSKPFSGSCHLDIKEKGKLVAIEDLDFSRTSMTANFYDVNNRPLGVYRAIAKFDKANDTITINGTLHNSKMQTATIRGGAPFLPAHSYRVWLRALTLCLSNDCL